MDFNIGDNAYRAGKLNAFDQLHLVRKTGPIIGNLVSIDVDALVESKDASSFQPVLDALAKMPEADFNDMIKRCLKAVTKHAGGGIYTNMTTADGSLMYEDVGMCEIIMMCYYVVKNNLANFTKGLPSSSITALAESVQKMKDQIPGS